MQKTIAFPLYRDAQKKLNIMEQFREQIAEDIKLIQKDWIDLDHNIRKNEYAFNYWVLSRLYDVDEQLIPDMITEYNDKSIDCYVHYEDSKELFIIQNKYYGETVVTARNAVNDFLLAPLICLYENNYKKSKELQKIFNSIKGDPEYKIHLHFNVTNTKRGLDSQQSIKNINNNPPIKINAFIHAEIHYLDNICDLYYGLSFKDNKSFNFTIKTKVRGTTLRILPEQYELHEMSQAYYILTPVSQLYSMYKKSIDIKYPLFEENIREYLGKNTINKEIINTLKSKTDRSNFFYYNNGITIICSKVGTPSGNSLELFQPQVVNGCQTINSIFEVLDDYTIEEIEEEFRQTFVMVKVLLFDEKTKILKSDKFYKDIVKYNNKQNSINENAFGARKEVFENLQSEFRERGFLLLVKPSDKNIFHKSISDESDLNLLFKKANSYGNPIGIKFNKLTDLFIPLEKLLQVYIAFMKDGYYAFTKKDALLKQTSEIYRDYSLKISETLTYNSLIHLYLIYLKADKSRYASNSIDKKNYIPYYLIGFFGKFFKDKKKADQILNNLFKENNLIFEKLFEYLQKLTTRYKKVFIETSGTEYNIMIKRPIDYKILDKEIETINDIAMDGDLKKYFESLN